MKKKLVPVINAVWANEADKRFIPRSNGGPDYSWDVWDQRKGKFVKSEAELLRIDPQEPLTLS